MTQSKWIVVGWTIFFSTLSQAAPKAKLGYAYSPKAGKAQYQALQATPKKQSFKPKHKAAPAPEETQSSLDGVDGMIYQAQKFASEMTQEVGYLLKATGPWLKEIEDQIRGVESSEAVAVAPTKGRALASNKVGGKVAGKAKFSPPAPAVAAPAPVASAPTYTNRRGGKRQLSNMSQSPNQIMDTISAFSKDTWEKVNALVSDLFASADE